MNKDTLQKLTTSELEAMTTEELVKIRYLAKNVDDSGYPELFVKITSILSRRLDAQKSDVVWGTPEPATHRDGTLLF